MTPKTPEKDYTLPIVYFKFDDEEFNVFATGCGCTPDGLRAASETAIRTRHCEAKVRDAAVGQRPEILTLSLGLPRSATVYYSVEPDAAFIRGYSWDIDGEPLDDRDGGYFYPEFRMPAISN